MKICVIHQVDDEKCRIFRQRLTRNLTQKKIIFEAMKEQGKIIHS